MRSKSAIGLSSRQVAVDHRNLRNREACRVPRAELWPCASKSADPFGGALSGIGRLV